VRRITKAALGGVAGCAMILGATQAANGTPPLEFYSRDAVRLIPMSSSAFDGANVTLEIKQAPDATNFKITVREIVKSETNPVHGAHLHNGPCPEVPLGADTTLGHYKDNTDITAAIAENEVWFDLEVNASGEATDSTTAQFVPEDRTFLTDPVPGQMSIVIHDAAAALPTSQSPKLACFPLEVTKAPQWIPDLI
jgi:hypothetical protein